MKVQGQAYDEILINDEVVIIILIIIITIVFIIIKLCSWWQGRAYDGKSDVQGRQGRAMAQAPSGPTI